MAGAIKPISVGESLKTREANNPNPYDMALDSQGGWKGLGLQLSFTGGKHTIALCTKITSSGKDCFPCFIEYLFLIND